MPEAPKRFERQYAEFTVAMIEQLAKRFKNQTLLALNKGTIEKFEDAQIGNFSRVYLTMANRVKRKLKKQFNNGRIDTITNDVLGRVNKYNQDRVYASASPSIGIDTAALIAREGLKPQVNALILETSQWAKKLRDDSLEKFTANTLRAMANGDSIEDIIAGFDQEVIKIKNNAKFLARNQIANFNGVTTKIRHQKLGIKKGIWITARDERVRGNPSGKFPPPVPRNHYKAHGKEFDLAKGYEFKDGKWLMPGQDYN